jgi:predicted RND superfamily exporter protein
MGRTGFLHRYATFIVDRSTAVVVGTLVVTALLAAQIPRLAIHFDPEGSLPPSHRFVRIDREIRKDFGGRRTMLIAVIPRQGSVWTAPVLRRVYEITQEALDLDGLMRHTMMSLASPNMRHLEDQGGRISEEYLMREPPTDHLGVAEVRRRYDANPLARGMVVSPDGRAAMLFLDFWDETDVHQIADAVRTLADRFTDDLASVHVAGEPIFTHENFEYSATMAPATGLSVLAIMVVLYLSFRSLQGMLIPMATALLSVLCDLGLMAIMGLEINSWNQGVPILVVTIAAGHSAQMMKRYYEELSLRRDNRAAVIATVERIGPVMVAAGTTAAIGFAALVIFGVPAISTYGLATAYGIASAVILEMTFIPALRVLLPVRLADVRPAMQEGRLVRVLDTIAAAAVGRGRSVIIAGACVVLAVAAIGAAQIRPWASLQEYLPYGGRGRRDLEAIREHFPGTNTMTVLVEGAPGAAHSPAVIRFLDGLGAELRADPTCAMTTSLADLVRFIRSVFDPESGGELPEDQRTLAQLVYLGSSPAFERFVDRSYSRTVLWAYLTSDASTAVRSLLARAERYAAAHAVGDVATVHIAGGTGPSLFALNEHTTQGKLWNVATVLVVVYVVASLILRSPAAGVFVTLPLVFALAVNLGILGWSGFALDIATTTIIAIGVGIGADYSMYLLYRMREEVSVDPDFATALRRTLATSGRAVIFVAIAIGAGFSVLAPARHLSWRLSGWLLPTTMIVSCTAAVVLVPTLVALTRPRFVFVRRATRTARDTEATEGAGGAAGKARYNEPTSAALESRLGEPPP